MYISKTLFKNLSRCQNFISLYDLYINRGFNGIKKIEGKRVNKDVVDTISTLEAVS